MSAGVVVASAWAFAAPFSATDARNMCAEHVLRVFSSLWDFDKTRRGVVWRTQPGVILI